MVNEQTPVDRLGERLWAKRDDLYEFGGVRGGKVRTCRAIAAKAPRGGTLVTAGARRSPQIQIVAHVALQLGLRCRAHAPWGESTYELSSAQALGCEIVTHRPGRNSVIVARCREDASTAPGAVEVPFGMECWEAVHETARQVANLPPCDRLVVPVGSGMTLAGVLAGLAASERHSLPVLGVVVGAAPERRLLRWSPDWQFREVVLERSPLAYHEEAPREWCSWRGLDLDPIYEAKAVPYLREGDCLWVVGKREPEEVVSC